jgi:Rrf2 family protein
MPTNGGTGGTSGLEEPDAEPGPVLHQLSMKFSKAEDYALILVKELGTSPKGVFMSLEKIAKEKKLSLSFLKKIAFYLRQANLLSSKEGKTGGYRLAKPLKKITLGDILLALGSSSSSPCQASCPLAPICQSKNSWNKIDNIMTKNLAKIKIGDL